MPVQSISVPLVEVSEAQLRALRAQLEESLVQILMTEASIQRDDISVRDMVPGDYSGTANDAQFVNQTVFVVDTQTLLVTAANQRLLTATQAYGFYGWFNRAAVPTITALRFSVGGTVTVGQFYLEPAYASGQNASVFIPPVLFHPTDTIQINALASAATLVNSEVCGFLGMVAEKIGTVISGRGTRV